MDKAQNIANAVNEYFHSECVIPRNINDYESIPGGGYIVIQTTSVGLYPNNDEAVIEDEAFYRKVAVGVDIIYNPAQTRFMRLVKAQGKKAYNGLKMLLYQGISAYELWNECTVSRQDAEEVYNILLKETGTDE